MNIGICAANSSVGRNLLRHLAGQDEHQVTAIVRSEQAAAALPAARSIHPRVVDYQDHDGLCTALQGCEVAVLLAGVLFESPGSSYARANVATTTAAARAAQAAGCRQLIFVSALGAGPRVANAYLRSKGEAEVAIETVGLPAFILRTPMLLGADSAAGQTLQRQSSRRLLWLLGGGRQRLRPLDLDDLSQAILALAARSAQGIERHDLVGPEVVTQRELIRRAAALKGNVVACFGVPVAVVRLLVGWLYRWRGRGITPAVIDVLTADEEVVIDAAAELDLPRTPLSTTLQRLIEASS